MDGSIAYLRRGPDTIERPQSMFRLECCGIPTWSHSHNWATQVSTLKRNSEKRSWQETESFERLEERLYSLACPDFSPPMPVVTPKILPRRPPIEDLSPFFRRCDLQEGFFDASGKARNVSRGLQPHMALLSWTTASQPKRCVAYAASDALFDLFAAGAAILR